MKETATDPHATVRALSHLKKALIDSSSIIYIQNAGYFDLLVSAIKLYTIQEVISEVRSKAEGLTRIHTSGLNAYSTDKALITCALDHRLAIISEDKRILSAMQRARAPYYNALMMLNLLLLSRKIGADSYRHCLKELKGFARYSDIVWEFGERVHAAVKLSINSGSLT